MSLNNKNILITGGTGSFGKKFIDKVFKKYKPKKLIVFSRDEQKQFHLQKKFPEGTNSPMRYFLGDVRDAERVNYALKDANLIIDFLYEDIEPINDFKTIIGSKKSLHLRLDNITVNGMNLPREKPYSIVLKSDIKIVAQLSRLDTTSEYNSFMTALGWGTDV